ncbi:MAG: polyprenyl synthetase [Streptomyces sp.]|nr:polyprenyl synthetase [Streptomyces sp.]
MADIPVQRAGLDQQAVVLIAGAADLALSSALAAFGAVRGLLRRSDGAELAEQAGQDLSARGRLVLDRFGSVPPAHLELLARHARSARPTGGGDD